jgi:hypothetical protein
MTQFMNVLTDPFVAGRGDGFGPSGGAPTGYASCPCRKFNRAGS